MRGALQPGVARRAAVGVDAAPVEDAARLGQLVGLGVVDQVAVDHDGVGPLGVERLGGGGEHLQRERLVGTEGGRERHAEAIEEGGPRGRLLVADVDVGDDAERAERPDGGCGAAEGRAVEQRLAGPALERSVPVAVDEGGAQGRAAGGGPIVAGRRQRGGRRDEHERGEDHGDAAAHGHSSRSPATGGSRSARRVTIADATPASATRPPATRTACPVCGAAPRSA